jgi:3-oxoadipate enol-lactonase
MMPDGSQYLPGQDGGRCRMRRQLTIGARALSFFDAGTAGLLGTLVLLHAFPLSAEMWEPQLEALPEGWRVLAPHLRGFGVPEGGRGDGPASESASQAPSIDDYAGDVLDLLDHLAVKEAVFAGLSMGGYVAFAILRRASDRCRGLILADTRPGADSPEARASRDRTLELLAQAGPAGIADTMLPRLLGTATLRDQPEVVGRVRALIEAQRAEAIRDAVLRLKTRPDSTDLLASIHCPALVVVGDDDVLTPVEESRRMKEAIRGATLAVIPGAGHLSNLEQPRTFNAAVARFLSDHYGSR